MSDEYRLEYNPDWDRCFSKFSHSTKERMLKKIQKLMQPLVHRHLKHGVPYFVEKVGGNRILFQIDENEKRKTIRFVGDHKQYEKWIRENT